MTIQQYQKKCSKEYLKSIKFPKENSYLYGNPVQTVVPIETAIGKIMVIGPQPTAKVFFVDDIVKKLPGIQSLWKYSSHPDNGYFIYFFKHWPFLVFDLALAYPDDFS